MGDIYLGVDLNERQKKDLEAFERWKTTAHLISGENFTKQIWLAACDYKEEETRDLLRILVEVNNG